MKRIVSAALALTAAATLSAQEHDEERLRALKDVAIDHIDQNAKLAQVMVDKVFSFAELGFHELETSRYITGLLKKEGFKIENGISGVPTAWWASWGSGKPVIAIGSDLDCIPKASQRPGVASGVGRAPARRRIWSVSAAKAER